MDPKKIGNFLKALRREKGITQEQLGEMLGVSGRTVSRWETGVNMPDLGVLIELSEYYETDIKEILDGERRRGDMDKEMKETLIKVADYNEMERGKAMKAGNTAFGIMFFLCAFFIVIQLILTGDLRITMGETAVLCAGGIAYIGIMVHQGLWGSGGKIKSSLFSDSLISVLCAVIFSLLLCIALLRKGAEEPVALRAAVIFFAGIGIIGFTVLRLLAFFSNKRKLQAEKEKSAAEKQETEPVEIFIADGNLQADMMIDVLKQKGIPAYKKDLGNAGFTSVRYGMGRVGDDRVAICVAEENADKARSILDGMF